MFVCDIFEDIDDFVLRRISNQLRAVPDNETLEINICSYGGEIFMALALIDVINAKHLKTICNIYGLAASSAAVIALSCDKVTMTRNGSMMIHSAFTPGNSAPDAGVDTCNARQLAIINKRCAAINIKSLKKDNWFNADQALKLGLIDEIKDNTNKEIEAMCDKYIASISINKSIKGELEMDEMKKEVIEELTEEKEEESPQAEEVSLVDIVEQLAERVSALEAALEQLKGEPQAEESPKEDEPKDDEMQARLNALYKSVCRPKSCASLGATPATIEKTYKLDSKLKSFV